MGEELSSRYFRRFPGDAVPVPVSLTPYRSEELIDDAELGAIIDRAFADAGLHPDNIDTGVVILTGEALRRENAEAIASVLAESSVGNLCARPPATTWNRCSRPSARGPLGYLTTPASAYSTSTSAAGTTKLALVERGKVIATAAVHVGGRLLVIDEARRIVRLDPAGRHLAAQAGFRWSRGDVADAAAMERVANGWPRPFSPRFGALRSSRSAEPVPD